MSVSALVPDIYLAVVAHILASHPIARVRQALLAQVEAEAAEPGTDAGVSPERWYLALNLGIAAWLAPWLAPWPAPRVDDAPA